MVLVDRQPSQPPSRRQTMSWERKGNGSVEESTKEDLGTGNSRLQRSNAKWTSGSGVITDSPPLQPLREPSVEWLEMEFGISERF
jgi:hypothetical protein